jgi:hypothetical protein
MNSRTVHSSIEGDVRIMIARFVVTLMAAALVLFVAAPLASAKTAGSGSMKINRGAAATSSVSVTINSSFSAATQMQVRNSGGSWSGWMPYVASYAWTLPAGDGTKSVDVQYKGDRGKATTKTDTIVLDTTAPVLGSLSSSTNPDEALWYAVADPVLSWTAPSDLSGVVGYSWVVDQTPDTVPDAVSEDSATGTTLAGLGDGVWYVHVVAIDAVGNVSAPQQRVLRVDTTAPETTDDAVTEPMRRMTLGFSANDAASGVALLEYRIDGGEWQSGSQVLIVKEIKHKRAGLTIGDHLVEYRAVDAAGNVETIESCTVTLR